ncbi:hypothetical protein LVJ82_13170 [Vitreoscilla massiliensis]|uniref:DUF4253 domain-containing protein n=1 Tax=Vitreoscilla massiliensis TaxID=1689272 RepID=A0ABY4DY19_9NEIS|nr:hypothetical protein [Vitreoscilla massiliensis]UOO88417.1 hypothetical protein LVJ82_13170 [Vitreoscilla massiliensis]
MNSADSVTALAEQYGFQVYPVRGQQVLVTEHRDHAYRVHPVTKNFYLVRTAAVAGVKQSLLLTEFEQQWHVSLGVGVDLRCLWAWLAEQAHDDAEVADVCAFLQQHHSWDEDEVDDGLGDYVPIQEVEPVSDGLLRPVGVGEMKLYDLQAVSGLLADFEQVFLPWFASRDSVDTLLQLIAHGDEAMMAALRLAHELQQRWYWKRPAPAYLAYDSVMFALGAPIADLLQGVLLYAQDEREQGWAALKRYQQVLLAKRQKFGSMWPVTE